MLDCRAKIPDHYTHRAPFTDRQQSQPLNYDSLSDCHVKWVEIVCHYGTMATATVYNPVGEIIRYWSR